MNDREKGGGVLKKMACRQKLFNDTVCHEPLAQLAMYLNKMP
jgi:hypothetical protein